MSIELHPRLANPEKVGLGGGEERDFEGLLAHLADRIKVRFGRVCYREKDFLVLDSSTEVKFSRHVVLVLDTLGCNSIDICLCPVLDPEPCPSHFWSFETYIYKLVVP